MSRTRSSGDCHLPLVRNAQWHFIDNEQGCKWVCSKCHKCVKRFNCGTCDDCHLPPTENAHFHFIDNEQGGKWVCSDCFCHKGEQHFNCGFCSCPRCDRYWMYAL